EVSYTAFTALESYIKNNKDTVRKFMRALYKAIKYLNEKDESVIAESLLGQFPNTSLESVATALASYKRIDAWMTNMAMTDTAFDNLQTIMENAGELTTRIKCSDITDNSFAESVYSEVYG
ncbi:MAG: ABC transporter substrate-binding protein, partial [Clostridia bacterium]|nr:ABC transporter substrate-binding protein [Clostridia bacterium]